MCGRYTVVTKMKAIEKEFNASFKLPYEPTYNGAPSLLLPVITDKDKQNIEQFRWGLIPFWAKDEKIGYKTINARTEDIITKPSFRKPIRSQRCLVLANCYFEWKKEPNGKKVPYVIYVQDQRLFAMGGVWDQWISPKTGEIIDSFSILTLPATKLLHPLHHRMPLILPKGTRDYWLAQDAPLNEVTSMFRQYPEERMNAYPVSELVNSPMNNTVDILQPVGQRIAKEVDRYVPEKTSYLEGMVSRKKRS